MSLRFSLMTNRQHQLPQPAVICLGVQARVPHLRDGNGRRFHRQLEDAQRAIGRLSLQERGGQQRQQV